MKTTLHKYKRNKGKGKKISLRNDSWFFLDKNDSNSLLFLPRNITCKFNICINITYINLDSRWIKSNRPRSYLISISRFQKMLCKYLKYFMHIELNFKKMMTPPNHIHNCNQMSLPHLYIDVVWIYHACICKWLALRTWSSQRWN